MRNARRLLVVPALAAALLATACSSSSSSESTPAGSAGSAGQSEASGPAGTFTIAVPSDPGNLDPSMTPSSVARQVLGLSYDTLVYQKDDGTIVSGLAEKWSSTPTEATFTLKDGITCSDGSPLTATDVADNIAYLADPKNASPLTGVLVHPGTTVKADDAARTVTVTSPSDNGFLLTELSGVFIICRAGLDDHAKLAAATIGTGPWVLGDAVADDHYDFAAHAGYAWGPDGQDLSGPGVPSDVSVKVVPNVTTTANLLLNNEVNFGAVSGPDEARLQSTGLKTIDFIDTSGETWFNQADGHPGADPAVREALTLAVNADDLGKIATGNNSQPSNGYITLLPNPCATTKPLAGLYPATDVEKAKQVLDQAGWTAGPDGVRAKDGVPLKIAFRYDQKGQDARAAGAEYLASQWKAIGVDVDVKALPEAQLNEQLFGAGGWDVAWANFTFNLPSQMVAFVSGPTPADGGANFPAIANADYDAAVKAATPQVGDAGCADWATAEKALLAGYNPVPMFDSVGRTYIQGAEIQAPGGQIWGSSLRLRSA